MGTRMEQFLQSEEGKRLYDELAQMVESEEYNTRTIYSASEGGSKTFIDKHMKYMSMYPNLDRTQYVSNLKLMTRTR